jgi:GNAT superfamily N-acetyltransferase
MKIYEAVKNEFIISTVKSKLNIELIQNYLSNESYWAKNIPADIVKKSIAGSCCFGLYVNENKSMLEATQTLLNIRQTLPTGRQVGFARVVTDYATFGYLADVFVIEEFRGKGLAKWMMQVIMGHPDLQGLRRWLLATKDAHGLYAKIGFLPLDKPERIMGFKPFEEYPKTHS